MFFRKVPQNEMLLAVRIVTDWQLFQGWGRTWGFQSHKHCRHVIWRGRNPCGLFSTACTLLFYDVIKIIATFFSFVWLIGFISHILLLTHWPVEISDLLEDGSQTCRHQGRSVITQLFLELLCLFKSLDTFFYSMKLHLSALQEVGQLTRPCQRWHACVSMHAWVLPGQGSFITFHFGDALSTLYLCRFTVWTAAWSAAGSVSKLWQTKEKKSC